MRIIKFINYYEKKVNGIKMNFNNVLSYKLHLNYAQLLRYSQIIYIYIQLYIFLNRNCVTE